MAEALADEEAATVGGAVVDEEHGHVCEVVVHEAAALGRVAARVARAGATPVLEGAEAGAHQCIGIERLDRIEARLTDPGGEDAKKNGDEYGLHRGGENGAVVAAARVVPRAITWDYMVTNVARVADLARLPQPLRQHAAKEAAPRLLDTAEARRHIPPTRLSRRAAHAQSKQLVEAFFLLEVERLAAPTEAVRALRLVLFRYMMERGYTARWMGRYEQEAKHIGNSASFRRFARLSQYDPHRLPTAVLNRLCGRDGKLRSRGAKGSRSKYVDKAKRYRPQRRLVRTENMEERMAAA